MPSMSSFALSVCLVSELRLSFGSLLYLSLSLSLMEYIKKKVDEG